MLLLASAFVASSPGGIVSQDGYPREGAMLQKLTAVAPRDNDSLTLRRGHALAQVLLLFMVVSLGLGAISLIDNDQPAQISTAIGMVMFGLVYAINRAGSVRLAMLILL